MKILVVYYSLTGSTRYAAGLIKEKYDADIVEIKEERQRYFNKKDFYRSALSAILGLKSKIYLENDLDISKYDLIFIGSPIWAGKPTPAFNSLMANKDIKNKRKIIFFTSADKDRCDEEKVKTYEKLLKKRGINFEKVLSINGFTMSVDDLKRILKSNDTLKPELNYEEIKNSTLKVLNDLKYKI